MDTRRAPDAREIGPKPELGTETVPVELVELQSVGSSGRGVTRKSLLAIAAIGIVVFAAIVATGKTPNPTPSPSAPAIGLASASPAPTPTVAPSAFRPTGVPPTPRPTPPPPWQWTRSELLPDLNQSARGMWGVGDNVLVLVHDSDAGIEERQAWSITRLSVPGGGGEFAAPAAIDDFLAGSVIDDRLWFLARVVGVTEDDATWQLVSTADGETWDSLGVAEGLPPIEGATFVGRPGRAWVVSTWRVDGTGRGISTVSWSTDGRHWTPGDVPEMPGEVSFSQSGTIGETMVILGQQVITYEDWTPFVLTSTDGRTWRQSSLEWPKTARPEELACNDHGCVITTHPFDDEVSTPAQTVLLSADGAAWTEVSVDVPYVEPGSWIGSLRATPTGFVATSGLSSPVLLSGDGRTWRRVEVLPPDGEDEFTEFAVANDIVAGLVDTSSDIPELIWVGSLAAMGN